MRINESQLVDFSKYKFKKDRAFENNLVFAEIQVEIAKAVIEFRNNNNYTQKDLSELLNVNQSMIAKLEKGNYNPSIKFLFDLSNKLSDDYSFFISVISRIQKLIESETSNRFDYDVDNDIKELKVSEKSEDYE